MRRVTPLVALAVVLGGCGPTQPDVQPSTLQVTLPGDVPPSARDDQLPQVHQPDVPPAPTGAGVASSTIGRAGLPRWRSAWWRDEWPVAARYGCTDVGTRPHDPRCPGTQGFRHGTEIAMACGTVVTSGVEGVVLDPATPTTPGPAYGPNALRVRTSTPAKDVVLGHARRLLVRPGQRVVVGTPLLEAGDLASEGGCRLSLEVRAVGGDVTTAQDPARVLNLTAD
ncbi:M23 family metallopeptidase [Arsenicicoccus dermatophilus]|uniref:M23 family metallopeptidase n=1 Tax=Arsenicicoccus dermatophilus TaxID=1076331 RepID=UPI001F4CEACC|nr:M23 family metallopeptidase [Arsenicicoccus dermatophilus]MCH8612421.1 M23 family metallopeptidase [Arsenicicoccus dermatophilus]